MRTQQDNNITLYSFEELQCMEKRIKTQQYNPFTVDEIKAELIKRTITPYCQKLADKLVKVNSQAGEFFMKATNPENNY